MRREEVVRRLRGAFGPGCAILATAGTALALLGPLPLPEGLAWAVGGALAASGVRAAVPPSARFLGLLPALAALGVLAAYTPLGTLPELVAGLGGLALLLWCAEDPDRTPGALGRGVGGVVVPAAAFGIAWTSSLLLPTGLGTVGIAAGLLAATVAAVVLLLRAPVVFERDPTATS